MYVVPLWYPPPQRFDPWLIETSGWLFHFSDWTPIARFLLISIFLLFLLIILQDVVSLIWRPDCIIAEFKFQWRFFFFWGRRMVNKLLDVVGYIWAFRNWRWSEQDQSPTSFLPMFVSFWSQAKEWCEWIRNVVRGEREDQGGWHRKEAEAHDNDGNARTERGRKALWLWGQEAERLQLSRDVYQADRAWESPTWRNGLWTNRL